MDQPSFIDPAHIADLPEVPDTERAWAAGFFDGEGCCGAYGTKRVPAPTRVQISVWQVETATLERFYNATGGGGYLTHVDRGNPKWKPAWGLFITALADVARVVALIWPFLSEPKRTQIRDAFTVRAANLRTSPDRAIGGQKLTDGQIEQIEKMLADGVLFQHQIAALFGVAQQTVSGIRLGRRKSVGQRKRSGVKSKGPVDWPHCPRDPSLDAPDFLIPPDGEGVPATERAWAAGFFDAEGTAIAKRGKHLSLSVAQTETSTLDRFRRVMGGRGAVRAKPQPRQPAHWKQGYTFQIGSKGDWAHGVSALWEFLSEPKRRQAAEAWAQRSVYREGWSAQFAVPHQRLSDGQVREIYALAMAGEMTHAEIGAQFGIAGSYVSGIKNRTSRRSATA